MELTEFTYNLHVLETLIFTFFAALAFRKPTTLQAMNLIYFYGLWLFVNIAYINSSDLIALYALVWVSRIALIISIYLMFKLKTPRKITS